MKNLFCFFVLLTIRLSSQCSYSIAVSFTPATCPNCCDGIITSTLVGSGSSCAPQAWTLQPLMGSGSTNGTWMNVCPASYTVEFYNGGCCLVTCSLNLNFTSTEIIENDISNFDFTYNNIENVLHLNNKYKNASINILGIDGKIIKELELDQGLNWIETRNLPVGMYIVIAFIERKPYRQFKIIKQ